MTCKDCLHYEACKEKFAGLCRIRVEEPKKHLELDPNVEKRCLHFTDNSKWVHLPCKVGDTVYVLLKGIADVLTGKVRKISFNRKNELVICIGRPQGNYYTTGNFKKSSFGKTVFLTYEEAERNLKELKNDEGASN